MVKEFTPSFIRKIGKDRLFLVAEKNNHMVGTATLQDNYIGTVFILPEFQGQGIGTKLMNKVEKIAKNNGVKRVMLNASITAYKFYKKRGYRFKQTIRDENYGKTYKMEKEVD
jgi:GNAT superfamily N-acetyltransferase